MIDPNTGARARLTHALHDLAIRLSKLSPGTEAPDNRVRPQIEDDAREDFDRVFDAAANEDGGADDGV